MKRLYLLVLASACSQIHSNPVPVPPDPIKTVRVDTVTRIVHDSIPYAVHDTTVVERIVHDTTTVTRTVHDSIPVPYAVHDTVTRTVHDSVPVPYAVHDTIFTPDTVHKRVTLTDTLRLVYTDSVLYWGTDGGGNTQWRAYIGAGAIFVGQIVANSDGKSYRAYHKSRTSGDIATPTIGDYSTVAEAAAALKLCWLGCPAAPEP